MSAKDYLNPYGGLFGTLADSDPTIGDRIVGFFIVFFLIAAALLVGLGVVCAVVALLLAHNIVGAAALGIGVTAAIGGLSFATSDDA